MLVRSNIQTSIYRQDFKVKQLEAQLNELKSTSATPLLEHVITAHHLPCHIFILASPATITKVVCWLSLPYPHVIPHHEWGNSLESVLWTEHHKYPFSSFVKIQEAGTWPLCTNILRPIYVSRYRNVERLQNSPRHPVLWWWDRIINTMTYHWDIWPLEHPLRQHQTCSYVVQSGAHESECWHPALNPFYHGDTLCAESWWHMHHRIDQDLDWIELPGPLVLVTETSQLPVGG